MGGWNLPDDVTDFDIEVAAGYYDPRCERCCQTRCECCHECGAGSRFALTAAQGRRRGVRSGAMADYSPECIEGMCSACGGCNGCDCHHEEPDEVGIDVCHHGVPFFEECEDCNGECGCGSGRPMEICCGYQ